MDEAQAKAKATYDAAADHFDHDALSFWDRYGRGTVERLALSSGDRVLDVCCGSGASALPAAGRVGPAGRVIGVDLSDRLLGLAETKAASLDLDNVEFVRADMTDLPYSDHSFDAVVCVFGIFFVPDMEAQVGELWRLVRPDGRLAITTWGPRLFSPAYEFWLETVRAERPDLYAEFLPWDRITTADSVAELYRAGGVPEVEVVEETGRQPLSAPEDFWTIALGSGLRWTIDQMGAETAERVRDAVLDRIEREAVQEIETNVIYGVATRPRTVP